MLTEKPRVLTKDCLEKSHEKIIAHKGHGVPRVKTEVVSWAQVVDLKLCITCRRRKEVETWGQTP